MSLLSTAATASTLAAASLSIAPVPPPDGETDRQPVVVSAVPTRSLPTPRTGEITVPDLTGDARGGTAARVHTADGRPVPGELFLLTGRARSAARARVFDETPYTLEAGELHPDSRDSNVTARSVVAAITGDDLDPVELTGARGSGPSGGLVYVLAHLNRLTDGSLTGDLRVGATGALADRGYVQPISAIDEKTVAAHLAGVDVLFTPSRPSVDTLGATGARLAGTPVRSLGGDTLSDRRDWRDYETLGATRTDGTLDLIVVRHLGDVAAYLCGGGSEPACDLIDGFVGLDETRRLMTLDTGSATRPATTNELDPTPGGHPGAE